MSEKLKFYAITAKFKKEPYVIVDAMRAINSNVAYEMFFDKHDIEKESVISYKIVCCGELRDFGYNTYPFGKCYWQVFEAIKGMPIETPVKISSVKTRMSRMYSEKYIGEAMRKLERDGYLKYESMNANNEHVYVKKGQVKE